MPTPDAISSTTEALPSRQQRRNNDLAKQLLIVLTVAAVYFAAAKLGLTFAFLHSHVSPIWPPTGIAIAAVLLFGYRAWPGIFIGALFANAYAPVTIPVAAVIAAGNTIEAVLTVVLLRAIAFDPSFNRARDVFKFVLAAGLCTVVSATIGTLALCITQSAAWNQFAVLWFTWWLGDLAGAVTVAPLLITWYIGSGIPLIGVRFVEICLLTLLLSVAAIATFGGSSPAPIHYYPLTRLIVPFLLWAAFRLGQRGVTLAIALLSGFAIWGTLSGAGPFVGSTPDESLKILQLFLASNAVTFLFLAAVVEERRHAEEARRAREEELWMITETTPVMLVRCSSDLRYVFVNRSYAQMLGREPREIIGKPIVEIVGAEGFEVIRPYIEKVLNGEILEYESEVPIEGVGTRFLRVTYRPELNEANETVGWIASLTDITESKRAEEGLRLLASIVESTEDGIIGKDLNGIITSWNAAAERLYGYTAQEIIGKPMSVLVPSDRPDEETQLQGRLNRGERIDHYETLRVAKDGREVPVSLTVSPIKDGNGNVIGSSKIARDITDRKRAEAERESLLQREHAARSQAEEANRVKDEFLATLSHELRTPLNAILGWASLFRGGQLSGKDADNAMEIIERNAKVQSQLIESVLDVSRIVSGKLQLDVRPLQLSAVIKAALDSIRPAADAKNMSVRVMTNSDEPLVFGDPNRLQQVVWNLLSNAVKFSPAGSEVTVKLQSDASEVHIVVKDSGQGIADHFLPHVFDRFRQADSSTTRKHGGLGLGLAIVRHLVELHGGSVTVESDGEGKGATFTVSLPALRKDIGTNGHSGAQLDGVAESELTLAGLKILIVEDQPDARELLKEMLLTHDADVKAAVSAAEALDVVREWQPQVVVSDISMPDVDGYTFIRRLRELGPCGGIPAIAVTAHAHAEDRERALTAGFQSHLSKPVELSDLLLSIAQVTNPQITQIPQITKQES